MKDFKAFLTEALNTSLNEKKVELPGWYVDMVQSQEKNLLKAVEDTKKGKGKFRKFTEASALIEFLTDFMINTYPELYSDNPEEEFLGKDTIDDNLRSDMIDNWLNSDDVMNGDYDDPDAIVSQFQKLGGWSAWYKLVTGRDWE